MKKTLIIVIILLLNINSFAIEIDSFGFMSPDSMQNDTVSDGIFDQPKINILNDSDTVPLTIKGVANQTANSLNITDSGDANVFEVNADGSVSNKEGVRTVTTQGGAGFGVQLYGEDTPEHTNQIGYYDHTGGAFEQLFVKTSGDDFTQADADNGTHILITGINGANPMSEIKQFISSTQVIVSGYGWDSDIGSVGSPLSFLSIKHPSFISGDGAKHEFSVEDDGEVEINSYGFIGRYQFKNEMDVAQDGSDGAIFCAEANGYSGIDAAVIDYRSGDLQPGDVGGGMGVLVDVSNAGSADSTTEVSAITVVVINGSDVTTNGIRFLPGFTTALSIAGSPSIDPSYGYDVTGGVVTDRVNGAPQAGTAFIDTSTTDATLFTATGDYYLIGSAIDFEIIDITLSTFGSKNAEITVEYSTGNGTWGSVPVYTDGTAGHTKSGLITFPAPAGWAVTNEAEASGDITSAKYIKISRTYGPVIPILPVESHFKIFASRDLGMEIRGDATVKPTTLADADALNDSIYYSSTQSKLVYKDKGGTVNGLY